MKHYLTLTAVMECTLFHDQISPVLSIFFAYSERPLF